MLLLVDTSAVIGCIIDEPERHKLLKAAMGRQLIAPNSLIWEVGNAFSAMFKQRRIQIDSALAAIDLYRLLPIEMREVGLKPSIILASRLGIYAYDAYVLQCALENKAELLTLDRGLKVVAKAAGVAVCEITS